MIEQREINRLRLVHTGKVLSNLCIVGAVYLLLTGIMPALTVVWYIIAGVVFVYAFFIKLFTAWQAPIDLSELSEWLFGNADTSLMLVFNKMSIAAPYVFAVIAVFAAGAIVSIAVFDRYKRSGRIISSSIALGAAIIGMLLIYVVVPGVTA